MSFVPGTMVTHHVRLTEKLGEGGMGSVWRAEHLGLDTEVAVKFIAAELGSKPSFATRFRREASSAAKVKSPHVVQMLDYGVMKVGTPYIIMELLEGQTLAERLKRKKRLPLNQAGLLLSQVAEALSIAHELGIVHRDIKPQNLFLIESGYELFIKVLDFGVAKQLAATEADGTTTTTGAVIGTPQYMSPEQIVSAKNTDSRADMWALAVVAYRAVTGKVPFAGDTVTGMYLAMAESRFERPSAIDERLPPELDEWFERAFQFDPEKRFKTVRQMAARFNQATDAASARGPSKVVGNEVVSNEAHTTGDQDDTSVVQSSAPTLTAAFTPKNGDDSDSTPGTLLSAPTLTNAAGPTSANLTEPDSSKNVPKAVTPPVSRGSELLTSPSTSAVSRQRLGAIALLAVLGILAVGAYALTGGFGEDRRAPATSTSATAVGGPERAPGSALPANAPTAAKTHADATVPPATAATDKSDQPTARPGPLGSYHKPTGMTKPGGKPRQTGTAPPAAPPTDQPSADKPAYCQTEKGLDMILLDGGKVRWVLKPECR